MVKKKEDLSEPVEQLDELIRRYKELDRLKKKAEGELIDLKGEMYKYLSELPEERYVSPVANVTHVKPERIEWDPDKVYDILGEEMFQEVSAVVVVNKAMEDAIKAHRVNKRKILPAMTVTPLKTYVKVT